MEPREMMESHYGSRHCIFLLLEDLKTLLYYGTIETLRNMHELFWIKRGS